MQQLLLENPIVDTLASRPILVVTGPDGRSVRAFERSLGGQTLDLYMGSDGTAFRLVDAQSGSHWDFSGKATDGPLTGKQLARIQTLKDYWFDWKLYNPQSLVYQAGKMGRQQVRMVSSEEERRSRQND
jgi:hypothetical protein